MAEPESTKKTASQPISERLTAFETVSVVGGLVLFLVLLYTMAQPDGADSFLSPPLVAVAGLILVWPLRKHHTVKALLFAGGFLLLLWFVVRLSNILLPFAFVYLLAYLFNPLVEELERRFKVPRWVSALLVTVLVLGVIVLFVLLLVPNLVGELKVLATRIINSAAHLREWMTTTPMLDRLEETGLIQKDDVIRRMTNLAQDQAENLASWIPDAVQGIVRSISSLLGIVTIVAIIPVILFYTLKDYPFIHRRVIELFPTFGGQRDYLIQGGEIVGSYLRGQLTISAIGAIVVSTALTLLGVPFGLLLGLLAGLLNMIPNLGALITMFIGILVAVIFGDPWYWDVVKVVVVLLGQGFFEQSVLTPNILSHHVGLHPVLILLSLFVFGFFLGIFGLLIAVPATAIIMTYYKAYRDDLNFELSSSPPPSRRPFLWPPRRRRAAQRAQNVPAPETSADAGTQKDSPEPPHDRADA